MAGRSSVQQWKDLTITPLTPTWRKGLWLEMGGTALGQEAGRSCRVVNSKAPTQRPGSRHGRGMDGRERLRSTTEVEWSAAKKSRVCQEEEKSHVTHFPAGDLACLRVAVGVWGEGDSAGWPRFMAARRCSSVPCITFLTSAVLELKQVAWSTGRRDA